MDTIGSVSEKREKYKRGMNPNSRKNLKLFEDGHAPLANALPGNGYSLTSELKQVLTNKERRLAIIESTIAGAILREPTPFRELWDRIEGKVPGDGAVINFNEIKILVVREEPKQLTEGRN